MFGSLRSVPPSQILVNTETIVAQDRKLTLRLLEHLHEIDRQKLYLERGFASTFDYCTRHLRLSEPSAARRIRTARCVARYPQLYALLESGELNPTIVAIVSKHLKPDSVDRIIRRISGKSKREVERIVAELEPRAALPPDRVRVVVVPTAPAVALAAPALSQAASGQVTVTGDSEKTPNSKGARTVTGSAAADTTAVQFERLARVEFTAHEKLMEKLDRVRSLVSHVLPANASLEQLITFMADFVIDRKDPVKRHERRRARVANQGEAAPATAPTNPRQIPAAVRDEVFTRDQRCTYVGPDGKRCNSTHVLQVDHINPVARGGAAVIDNLRLLCAHHNRLECERLMGKRERRNELPKNAAP
jgi:5-methylcytosine-specific restriction endonuclease McrA